MSTNLDFQDDRIIVERHYIPYRLYREIYIGYQQPPTSIAPSLYSPPNNITRQQNPYTNPYTNPYAPIHIDLPPTTHQSRLYPRQQYNQQAPDNQPSHMNTLQNRYSREEQTRQSRQPIHTTEDQNIFETPSEIRNLVSNLLNNRMPFELQVSTIPLGMGMGMGMGIGLVQNDNINSEINNRNQPLSLSNINIISTVSRFDDLSISFDLSDTCSICQLSFNDNDITRMLNNCKHIFHLTCIDTWLTEHNTCPSCRHNLIDDLTPNISVQTHPIIQTPTHSPHSNIAINNSTTSAINLDNEVNNAVNNVDNVVIEEIEEIDNSNTRNSNGNGNSNRNSTANPSTNTRIFSNFTQGTTNGIRDDINHFINIGAPFINSLLPNTSVLSNVSPILNTSEINNNVNTLFENINPFISAFAGLLNGGPNMNSHSNVSANVRMYSSM